jgi:uncharacterized membrane protein
MIRTRKSITIDRPVDEVFKYMADFENDMEWRNELLEIQRVSESEGEGATYHQRVQYEGYEGEETFEITELEPNRRLAFQGRTGDILAQGEYRFIAEDGKTKVEVSAEMSLSEELRPIEPVIADVVKTQGELDLDHLKDILEHRRQWREK